MICLKGVEFDDVLLTFLFTPPPNASFSLGFGEGAMIKLVLEAAATVSGAAIGILPVPNLLNDWDILLYFASDGGEANPRGRIFTFDDGDARYVEIFVEETGRMFLLSLWLIAVIADERVDLFRKLSFCSSSLRFASSAANWEVMISLTAGAITEPSGGAVCICITEEA